MIPAQLDIVRAERIEQNVQIIIATDSSSCNENFAPHDGTPIELKALLWNRYYHWEGWMSDQEAFRNWYKKCISTCLRINKKEPQSKSDCKSYHLCQYNFNI